MIGMCPRCCRGVLGWDKQSDLELAGVWFVERRLVCEVGACWVGPAVLFRCPKPDWARLRDGETPGDLLADSLPMRDPCP